MFALLMYHKNQSINYPNYLKAAENFTFFFLLFPKLLSSKKKTSVCHTIKFCFCLILLKKKYSQSLLTIKLTDHQRQQLWDWWAATKQPKKKFNKVKEYLAAVFFNYFNNSIFYKCFLKQTSLLLSSLIFKKMKLL